MSKARQRGQASKARQRGPGRKTRRRGRVSGARWRAWRYGRRAEWLATWYLRLKGYRIVATNLRLTGGEIDIVARKGRLLAFIEVKARQDMETAQNAISLQQQARVAAAAKEFLSTRPQYQSFDGRFDALLLAPRRLPRHIRDAWRLGD